jgi:hypothetical protein
MYRRRKDGKPSGNWYFHHPVTGDRESTGTSDRALAKAIVAKAEREAVERKAGLYVRVSRSARTLGSSSTNPCPDTLTRRAMRSSGKSTSGPTASPTSRKS